MNDEAVYFEFTGSQPADRFVVRLYDPEKIDQAKRIIAGQETVKVHVAGTIIPRRVHYNPAWSYHLQSDSIHFFEISIEVCDADMQYIETHLDQIGGSFLPKAHWCPWNSKLTREVPNTEFGG
jgi:hypothetical protein